MLDANTGQNALAQVKAFDAAVGLTGLIVTKLDGSAKGGVVAAIAKQHPVPIRFIGVGESVDDLQRFVAAEFVDALLPPRLSPVHAHVGRRVPRRARPGSPAMTRAIAPVVALVAPPVAGRRINPLICRRRRRARPRKASCPTDSVRNFPLPLALSFPEC